jgi:hypothetical protein
MIEKIKDKFRDHPTWRGVTVGLTTILVASLVASWLMASYSAEQAAENAFGRYVVKMESILDRMEKLSITQTQNVNVGGDGEKLRDKRLRDLHAERGNLSKE